MHVVGDIERENSLVSHFEHNTRAMREASSKLIFNDRTECVDTYASVPQTAHEVRKVACTVQFRPKLSFRSTINDFHRYETTAQPLRRHDFDKICPSFHRHETTAQPLRRHYLDPKRLHNRCGGMISTKFVHRFIDMKRLHNRCGGIIWTPNDCTTAAEA